MCDNEKIYDMLADCKLFNFSKTVDKAAFEAMMSMLHICDYAPGQRILTEGNEGSEMYFIYQGLVEFSSQGIALGTKDAGSYFGEIAMFTTCQRTCSAMARLPTQLLVLMRNDFKILLNHFPDVFADAVKETYQEYSTDGAQEIRLTQVARNRMKNAKKEFFSMSMTGDIRSNFTTSRVKSVKAVIPEALLTNGSISLFTLNLSLGSSGVFKLLNKSQADFLSRHWSQRLIFNSINSRLDGKMTLVEFMEFWSAHRDEIQLRSGYSPESCFSLLDKSKTGFINEEDFCASCDEGFISISPDLLKQLESTNGSRTKWKEFGNVALWYLFLPVSLLLAPERVRKNIILRVEVSSEIEVQSRLFRKLKNSWTTHQIRTHCNWNIETKLHEELGNEGILFEKMAVVETRITGLKEKLKKVKEAAIPGAFNLLEFFIHTLPPFLHSYIDEVLTGEQTTFWGRLILFITLMLFSFTIHVIPITSTLLYHIYRPENLATTGLSEIYMPLVLFGLIICMQAVQDAVTTVTKDDREVRAMERHHGLSLYRVHCSEAKASNAKDLYDWISFVTTKQHGCHTTTKTHTNGNIMMCVVPLLTLLHGFLPMITRAFNGVSPWGCDEKYCYFIVIGNIWSSIWLFWLVLDYLVIGYRVYQNHIHILTTFINITDINRAKKLGLPYLGLDHPENIVAWSQLRLFIMYVDEWKYRWIDSMLTMLVVSMGGLFLLNVVMILFSADVDTFLVLNLYDISVIASVLLFIVHLLVKVEHTRVQQAFVLNQAKWDLSLQLMPHKLKDSIMSMQVKSPVKRKLNRNSVVQALSPISPVKEVSDDSVRRHSSVSIGIKSRPSDRFKSLRRENKKDSTSAILSSSFTADDASPSRAIAMEQCMQLIQDQITIIERSRHLSSSKILGFTVDGAFMARLTFLCASFVISMLFRFSTSGS